jgi:hypothetical protein
VVTIHVQKPHFGSQILLGDLCLFPWSSRWAWAYHSRPRNASCSMVTDWTLFECHLIYLSCGHKPKRRKLRPRKNTLTLSWPRFESSEGEGGNWGSLKGLGLAVGVRFSEGMIKFHSRDFLSRQPLHSCLSLLQSPPVTGLSSQLWREGLEKMPQYKCCSGLQIGRSQRQGSSYPAGIHQRHRAPSRLRPLPFKGVCVGG